MRLGAITYSLRAVGRTEAFAAIAGLGLVDVELWVGLAPWTGAAPSAAVVAEAAAFGLRLGAYSIGGLLGLPRATVRERIARAADFARGLGVGVMTGIVDPVVVHDVDVLCGERGVRFAIENHWYAPFARAADYAPTLTASSPAIGVALDTGHLAYAGDDVVAAVRAFGDRLYDVHLKVVAVPGALTRWWRRRRGEHRMPPGLPGPGDGFDRVLPALAAAGYDGLVAIEHEGEAAVVDVLRRHRARAEAVWPGGAAAARPAPDVAREVAHG